MPLSRNLTFPYTQKYNLQVSQLFRSQRIKKYKQKTASEIYIYIHTKINAHARTVLVPTTPYIWKYLLIFQFNGVWFVGAYKMKRNWTRTSTTSWGCLAKKEIQKYICRICKVWTDWYIRHQNHAVGAGEYNIAYFYRSSLFLHCFVLFFYLSFFGEGFLKKCSLCIKNVVVLFTFQSGSNKVDMHLFFENIMGEKYACLLLITRGFKFRICRLWFLHNLDIFFKCACCFWL